MIVSVLRSAAGSLPPEKLGPLIASKKKWIKIIHEAGIRLD